MFTTGAYWLQKAIRLIYSGKLRLTLNKSIIIFVEESETNQYERVAVKLNKHIFLKHTESMVVLYHSAQPESMLLWNSLHADLTDNFYRAMHYSA